MQPAVQLKEEDSSKYCISETLILEVCSNAFGLKCVCMRENTSKYCISRNLILEVCSNMCAVMCVEYHVCVEEGTRDSTTFLKECGNVGVGMSGSHSSSTATYCNTIATHCNTLQHTATNCNTLQHTATHCNVLQHRPTSTTHSCA